MKKILILFLLLLNIVLNSISQSVGIGTSNPNSSALLDISSSSKGALLPRMNTVQRNAIVNPATGLTVFNTDDQCLDIYDGSNWIKNCGLKQIGTVNVPANTWTKKADFGGILRRGAVGFSIGGKGYIGTGDNTSYLNDFWEYDTLTNSWQQKANVGGPARGYATGFSIAGKGYIGLGRDPAYRNDFWEYDPVANSWTQKADFSGPARAYAAGFSTGSKGYIGTGYNGTYLSDFREYDPLTNSWSDKPAFPGKGLSQAVAFSISGKGYIGTGYSPDDGFETDEFWEFNPAANLWTRKADFKTMFGSLKRLGATGFSIGTKGYIGTGQRTSFFKDFWEYDPVANTWTQKADFGGLARYIATGFSIGSKGYIGTGSTGGAGSKDFWEYNQTTYSTASYSSLPPTIINTQVNDGVWTKNFSNDIISSGNAVTISGTGNLGIGINAPGYPLSFPSTVSDKISLYGSSGNHYGLGIQGGLLQVYTDASASDVAFGYGSSDAFTETMRIKGNGNVGIGTTTPTSLLNVNGQLTIDQKNFGGYGGMLLKGNAPGSNYPNIAFSIKNNASTDIIAAMMQGDLQNNSAGAETIDLTFLTSQTGLGGLSEKMRIKANGFVGIGTSTPIRPLSFPAALGEKILLYPGGTGEVGIGVYGNELRLHADNPGAKVSFGTQDNVGNFTENAKAERNGVYAFSIFGSLWVNGTTYASDERFKQNITTISSPLQKLLQINGVEYEMKTSEFPQNYFASGRQIGLLAQNVEKIIPEAVNEKEGYKGVDYARLVPLIIEGLKEQQKQILQQQQQIIQQQQQIEELKKNITVNKK